VIGSGHLPQGVSHDAESTSGLARGPAARPASHQLPGADRRRQVQAEEIRLLHQNATTGIVATLLIALVLAYIRWDEVAHATVATWLTYMLLVSAGRLVLVNRYWRASAADIANHRWLATFVAGTSLAALGWGVGAIVLYPDARSTHEIAVIFAVGGVMLGGASLLAARPEAFLTFLLPTGLLTAVRVAIEGDRDHVMMGLLGAVFTVATVITTWRFYVAIESSLMLRFENQDLIGSLRAAKNDADALNRDLELRVRDRTAKLIEEDQRKDEFLATLAHELRNPLAAIRFALETLNADEPPAVAARARDVIRRQVGQLVRLVDDLLDVSRIAANKIQLRHEPLDLARLMTTAVESITPLATAAEQTLDLRLPATPISIDGDGARLVQVFANVLSNATKFTPRGGRISFSGEQQADEAVVFISDTGVGIDPETLPRVFDMFHQAEPVLDRATAGLGIGLTLARRLVEMHEGQIAIRSAGIGQGTEVEIRLPVTDAQAAAPSESIAPPTASARALRVLIVEDNVDAAEMLELAVSRLGHLTRLAHDGAAAVAAATEFAPDVILLDIGLPVMNGYAVARALRDKPEFRHVQIAALTGWGQEEDRRKARDAGCDSHFTKPLSPDVLEDLLATVAQAMAEGRPAGTPRTRRADSGGAF
jgi:signal transduction histidine kinase/CheY-like chemotaxis protein